MKTKFNFLLVLSLIMAVFLSGCGFSDSKKNDGEKAGEEGRKRSST